MPNVVTAVSLASLLTVGLILRSVSLNLLALVTGLKVIMDANQL